MRLSVVSRLVFLVVLLLTETSSFQVQWRRRVTTAPFSSIGTWKSVVSVHDCSHYHQLGKTSKLRLSTSEGEPLGDDTVLEPATPPMDSFVKEASQTLKRVSWFSWWSQVILSTVSSVTLLFAKNVLAGNNNQSQRIVVDGIFLAAAGAISSFLSILWTWSGSRLGRRFEKKPTTRIAAANLTRRIISVGVTLNLMGMLLTLIGAEQIIGGLAVKVLTQQGVLSGGGIVAGAMTAQSLQPLDILIVQANTNTLLSHFCSLVALLYLSNTARKLDPPSVEGDERKRA